MKRIASLGDSLDRLRMFPEGARRASGHRLDRAQRGLEPDDWQPMPTIGVGVREIRIREAVGAFRVSYLATLPEAVYVLHAFQKKTQATARRDLALAARAGLGITQPRPSDLLRGRVDRLGLDALVDLAARAGLGVRLEIGAAA